MCTFPKGMRSQGIFLTGTTFCPPFPVSRIQLGLRNGGVFLSPFFKSLVQLAHEIFEYLKGDRLAFWPCLQKTNFQPIKSIKVENQKTVRKLIDPFPIENIKMF